MKKSYLKIMINKLNIAVAVVLFVSIMLIPVNVFALTQSQLQAQKDYLQAQTDAAKQKAAQKQKDAAAIQSQISNIDSQISQTANNLAATESNIAATQKAISDLEVQIKASEDELAAEKAKLNGLVASWYMQDQSGLLETMIGSNNLSDIITEQQYYDSVNQRIEGEIQKVESERANLNKQKQDQTDKQNQLLADKSQQEAYKAAIESKKVQKNQILKMTQAEQSALVEEASRLETQVSQVTEQLKALRSSTSRNSGEIVVLGGSGGYAPEVYAGTNVDIWGFVTYQCTSYAAWYWNKKVGKHWVNTRPGSGSAWNWAALASDQGYSVSKTARVGALVAWGRMPASPTYGHVAVVEAVHGDGRIDISEYNWSISEGFGQRYNVDPGYWGDYNYIYY